MYLILFPHGLQRIERWIQMYKTSFCMTRGRYFRWTGVVLFANDSLERTNLLGERLERSHFLKRSAIRR